jgi:alpha-tubulin suppressor-like RCC1 family protein
MVVNRNLACVALLTVMSVAACGKSNRDDDRAPERGGTGGDSGSSSGGGMAGNADDGGSSGGGEGGATETGGTGGGDSGEGGESGGGASGEGGSAGDDGKSARAILVDAGAWHTCALLSDGSARCWGSNDFGQLGSGTTGPSTCVNNTAEIGCSLRPVPVLGLSRAKALSLGGYQSCAVLEDGTVRCWGLNDYGELGIGTQTGPSTCRVDTYEFACATTPVAVSDLTNVVAVAASDEEHACALLANGSARCWGLNGGQLGYSYVGPSACRIGAFDLACAMTPVDVSNLTGATALDTATFHTCAVVSGGSVRCWGSNLSGELGNGSTAASLEPSPVSNLTNATAISTGSSHSCALLANGTVACWGRNDRGQLGIGPAPSDALCRNPNGDVLCSTTPVTVTGLTDVSAISVGGGHTCALLRDGTVSCWGMNDYGQIGNMAPTGLPTPMPDLTDVVSISAGALHTCAVRSDGSVRCWGYNVFGQLGDGTTTLSQTPVAVTW